MENEEKKVQQLLRVRTASGCVSEGWRMLADNIWFLIRASLPMLLMCCIWAVAITLVCQQGSVSMPIKIMLITCSIIMGILGILQAAILVRKYHTLGYFPALRAPWQSKNKSNAPTAFHLITEGLKPTKTTTLRLLLLMIKRVRRWGQMLGVLIIGWLSWQAIALIGSLPFIVLILVQGETNAAVLLGDAIDTPSWLPVAQFITAALSTMISYIASLTLLLPMAFFCGSLQQETIEELTIDD